MEDSISPSRPYLDRIHQIPMTQINTPAPVCISYADLTDQKCDLTAPIEAAFGSGGLGLITISGIPDFVERRRALLPLATPLTQSLSPSALDAITDPVSFFNSGYSRGRETLENGAPDTRKASFFATPLTDDPSGGDAAIAAAHPAYARPNLWPSADLPQLEPAFKSLGSLIIDVGMRLAGRCDDILGSSGGGGGGGALHAALANSPCHKGRLLCYLPPEDTNPNRNDMEAPEQWCGWHVDHCGLTGLTAAMFTDATGAEATCEDPQAGLHVRTRGGEVVRVVIPRDCLAFQLGETFQAMSGGRLQATPHCVVAPRAAVAEGLHRNTLAVFMQPRWDQPLGMAGGGSGGGGSGEDVGLPGWVPGMTFGDFSTARFSEYYNRKSEKAAE